MSDYHVLEFGRKGPRVAMHIPVPDQNNAAGVNYRTAVVATRDPEIGTTSIVGNIDPAEQVLLTSGALIEVVVTVPLNPDLPNTGNGGKNKLALLDAAYSAQATETQTKLAQQLQYYGFSRDVP